MVAGHARSLNEKKIIVSLFLNFSAMTKNVQQKMNEEKKNICDNTVIKNNNCDKSSHLF